MVDAQGNRCPTALNDVRFKLDGPAEWRGGLAQTTDNGILATMLPVECGINRVIVRSTTTPGTITITASADGLTSATSSVQTSAIKTDGGLEAASSIVVPQPSLARGPTPAGDSVHVTRVTVKPSKLEAGSNVDAVASASDDNEDSSWSSTNKLSDAWLQFDFDAPTKIDELVARFGSWRTTSYPIRVFADDKAVFEGIASSTIGYTTIRFPGTTCKTLRIQLAGTPSNGGNAELIEVTGKTDTHGGDDAKAKGKLVIHEIELLRRETKSE
ncbi:MAG: discoidin domain-containing protein [Tepidisphaeraceae bacterium]